MVSSIKSFNPKTWANGYEKNKNDVSAQKSALAGIFAQTQEAAKNGFYVDGKKATISSDSVKKMQAGTMLINKPTPVVVKNPHKQTTVSVENGDTIAVATRLKEKGFNVVSLNMANAKYPGGGAKSGARAQEESIFRASNYYQSLYRDENKTLDKRLGNKSYYVPEIGGIYSPSVSVFRKSINDGFAFQKPVELDFIAAAAPDLKKGTPKKYDDLMAKKIRGIFRIAAGTGHDTVVVGAHGCGAFKNPPEKVSALFKQVMLEKEFKGAFKNIVFAIINDHNGKDNFEVFDKKFKNVTF